MRRSYILENKYNVSYTTDHHLIVRWQANSIKLSSNMQNDMILQWLHIHFPAGWLHATPFVIDYCVQLYD